MNSKKSDDDFFEEDFNEEFDFGEENFEKSTRPSTNLKQKFTKPALGLVSVLIVAGLGYYGYQYYRQYRGVPNVSVAKKEPPVVIKKKPAVVVTAKTPPAVKETKKTPEQPLPSGPKDISPKDLKEFIANEPVVTPTPIATTTTQTATQSVAPPITPAVIQPAAPELAQQTKTDTIQDLQQELFENAESKSSQTVPATGVPANTTSTEIQQIKEATETLTKLNQQLSQQMERNLSQIKNLDTYTRDISQTIGKLNSEISAMDNRILALTNTTTTLSKEIKGMKGDFGGRAPAPVVFGEDVLDVTSGPIPAGKRGIAPPNILIEEPEYAVHAVIPGRAWLKSSKGQIVTVTEGDNLGNYGKILVIDATNGVVLSSSGIAFR